MVAWYCGHHNVALTTFVGQSSKHLAASIPKETSMRPYRLHGRSIVLLYSLGAAAAASGCASADRFSAMTAADHEQAAR
jgi:hypothetical protein